jgi:hypothetical protein
MARTAPEPRAAHPVGRPAVRQRSPVREACLSLLTVSVYGFWWWYDLNRQLRTLGQPARPGRALGEVLLGLAVVAPGVMAGWPWLVVGLSPVVIGLCLLSVWQTVTALAAGQRSHALGTSVSIPLAVGLAATALVGAVGWYALAVLEVTGFLFLGVLWPLVAMLFVAYLQGQLNAVIGDR